MNSRCFARLLLLRGLAGSEFRILLVTAVALAAVAGAASTSGPVAADPVTARLINAVPTFIFAGLATVSPLVLVKLAAADRDAGWTAPLFAGGGSPITYLAALLLGVSLAAMVILAGSSIAFHIAALSPGTDVFARILTGTISLVVLCAYAAVLWVLIYDRARTLVAMALLWLGPLIVGAGLAVTRGFVDQPLWLRLLLLLVPPVRMTTALVPIFLQTAYIALLAAVLVVLSPRRVPFWQ